jgi:dynamin 1-like protein
MQRNIKPIHMPRMTNYKRAGDHDPGQSSPRANMETSMIKNLIMSYFGTVRKTMNDMVPKTVMAFLVNKSKNQAQRQLVQCIYKDGQDL